MRILRPRRAPLWAVCLSAGLPLSSLAAEHVHKLFTRFWRGPQRRDEGAGLGLAICQEIAAAHGWALSARNNGERGAVFSLRFGGATAAGSSAT